jgi:hypothetical protein
LVVGLTRVTGATLLTPELRRQLGATGPPVTVGWRDLRALHYVAAGAVVEVWVVPTTAGMLTLGCTAGRPFDPDFVHRCEASVGSVRLVGARPLPLTLTDADVRVAQHALAALPRADGPVLRVLRRPRDDDALAVAADRAAGALARARGLVVTHEVSPVIMGEWRRFLAALAHENGAYVALARATRSGHQGELAKARHVIAGAHAELAGSLRELERL